MLQNSILTPKEALNVSKLLWSNDYSVNIISIDNEHKLLVELINEFDSALDIHGAFQTKIVIVTLNKLALYIRRHFESEERFLQLNSYPDYNEHKQDHDLLLDRLSQFERNFLTAKQSFNEEMLLFLKDWLVRHIILHDHKFGEYYRDKDLINHFD